MGTKDGTDTEYHEEVTWADTLDGMLWSDVFDVNFYEVDVLRKSDVSIVLNHAKVNNTNKQHILTHPVNEHDVASDNNHNTPLVRAPRRAAASPWKLVLAGGGGSSEYELSTTV